jgi:hypothetical protein
MAITAKSHQQWTTGFRYYEDGLPCPVDPEQAAGWKTAQTGSCFSTGIDLCIDAGISAEQAEVYALEDLNNAIARDEAHWNRQMMAGI